MATLRICKILVVEDDDGVRSLLGDVLDLAGYDFTLVDGAAEMRAALDAEEFDVAIIDVSLRGGENGFVLGELAEGKGCRVILTTGDPGQRARLEMSGRRHLIKPFHMQTLTELVDQVLTESAALCEARPRGDPAPLPASA
jgi:two-component system OmpR family response regulator